MESREGFVFKERSVLVFCVCVLGMCKSYLSHNAVIAAVIMNQNSLFEIIAWKVLEHAIYLKTQHLAKITWTITWPSHPFVLIPMNLVPPLLC